MIHAFHLTVTVMDDDGDGIWMAEADNITEYGAGNTPELAVIDFLSSLSDSWQWLRDNEEALGTSLQRELSAFRRRISEVQP